MVASLAPRASDVSSLTSAVAAVVDVAHVARARIQPDRALIVAISGVDGAGKTSLAAALEGHLVARGTRVARVGQDTWRTEAATRFGGDAPAARFYEHAYRFEALMDEAIEPLRRTRRLRLEHALVEPRPGEAPTEVYAFDDVDVVLLEGLFLLRRDRIARYDLRVWIECSFATSVARALARNQEGLPPDALAAEYRNVYVPAEELHLALDDPRSAADVVIDGEVASP